MGFKSVVWQLSRKITAVEKILHRWSVYDPEFHKMTVVIKKKKTSLALANTFLKKLYS